MAVQHNHSQIMLLIENARPVNESRDISVFLANFPILVVAVTVNIWVGVRIRKMQDNRINKIIVCDCVVNILSMLFDTFYINAPWTILKSLPPCYILIFASKLMNTWNRLMPMAIVVFRYLMVCRAVYCHNLGGEKAVLRRVMSVLVAVCLLHAVVIAFNNSDVLIFLRCIGREEAFR